MPRVILGIDPRSPTDYTGLQLNAVPTVQAARQPLVTDRLYPLQTIWRITRNPTTGAEGDEWILVTFETNGDARWVMFTGGGGGAMTNLRADDGNLAFPLAGVIDVDGNTVPNGTNPLPLYTTATVANTVDWNVQVTSAVAPTPANNLAAGVASFDNTQFTADTTTGFVQLAGGTGPALQSVDVDFNTPPGTDPVIPDAMGQISILGNTVPNATNLNSPIATHSRNANEFNIDVQVASAVAPSPIDAFDAGIASFDNTQFTVDPMTGFVQFVGGAGPAMQSFTVDANTPPGTNPVVPDAMGNVDILGASVLQQGIPIETHSRAANAFNIEVQETTIGTTGNDDLAGIAYFDQVYFNNTRSFVSLNSNAVTEEIINLGITYSAGTGVFTVTSADGSPLSAANPAFVRFQDPSNPGQNLVASLTNDIDFIDSNGASEIIGNTFGTTAGIAWGDPMPFFLYAVLNVTTGNTFNIAIARSPTNRITVAGPFSKPSVANANSETDYWFFDNITDADYEDSTVVRIGCFRMTKDASDDWTVQTLNRWEGINRNFDNYNFIFPFNQNGASVGSWFSLSGAGTLPVVDAVNRSYNYRVMSDGMVEVKMDAQNIVSAGVGTSNFRIHLPLIPQDSVFYSPGGHFLFNNAGVWDFAAPLRQAAPSVNFFEFISAINQRRVQPGDIPGTVAGFVMTSIYRGFTQSQV